MDEYLASAAGAFQLLARDYERLLEYVHPSDANLGTYSHRTYELLLRACTEFESISKGAAAGSGIAHSESESNVRDWAPLLHKLELAGIGVAVIDWTPQPREIAPLDGWDQTPHQLVWYRAYNDVKHNRFHKFEQASLQQVTSAISACFLLLVRLRALPLPLGGHRHLPNNRVEIPFSGLRLTLRCHDTWEFINAGN